MSFRIELSYSAGSYFVTDYLVESSKIPLTQRNFDYGITTKGFKFSVSQNYNNTVLDNATDVKIYDDLVVLFWGTIKNRKKKDDSFIYEFHCFDRLIGLDDIMLDYETLNTDTIALSSYVNIDNISRANVGFLDFLENVVFKQLTGATGNLTTTAIDSFIILQSKAVVDDVEGSSTENFTYSDLRLGVSTIWAINQDYAISHTKIASNDIEGYDTLEHKITLLDYLDQILKLFTLTLNFDPTNTLATSRYILSDAQAEESYSVTDDLTFKKDISDVLATDANGTHWELNGSVRTNYASPTNTNSSLVLLEVGTGDTKLQWYKNMMFFLQGKWVGAIAGDVYNHTSSGATILNYATSCANPNDNDFTGNSLGYKMESEVGSDRTETTITTDVNLAIKNVQLRSIDLEDNTMTVVEVS